MALRSTLEEVVEKVRKEARLSTNTSRGTDHLENIKQLIRRHYETLYEQFDWPHLDIKRNDSDGRVVMQAGQRFYDFPDSVNRQKVYKVWVKWSGLWNPLAYGVGFPQYSQYDPAQDQRTDPVTHWAWSEDDQFEVWPLPASNGTADDDGEVAFEGQKAFAPLVDNADVLLLDDIMVSLYVAAEILAGNGQKTAAEVKAAAAKARLDMVRGNMNSQKRVCLGVGVIGEARPRPRHPVYIR